VDGHAARTIVRETARSQKRTGRRFFVNAGARSQPTWKERVGKAVASAGINPGPQQVVGQSQERDGPIRNIIIHDFKGDIAMDNERYRALVLAHEDSVKSGCMPPEAVVRRAYFYLKFLRGVCGVDELDAAHVPTQIITKDAHDEPGAN